ncbi:MAG: hypothetical protein RJB26_670 [Pseudomonadota bacterium]|jgi:hypothetical protein
MGTQKTDPDYESSETSLRISDGIDPLNDIDQGLPTRWICKSCDWIGNGAEVLRAPSPFDAAETIVGCPKCKAVEDMAQACDEPGCTRQATCGFQTKQGYRQTCGEHFRWWDERPSAKVI